MSCVNVRGCPIGEGRPKTILPIVEGTEAAILEKAVQFSTLPADCVEWRADWFQDCRDPAAVARCLQKLRVALGSKLLLVTFRTQAEGGQAALSPAEYRQFLELVLDTDCADLLDIEFFTAGADLPLLVEQTHTAGVPVVCSSHDFAKTPPRAELVERMVQMQRFRPAAQHSRHTGNRYCSGWFFRRASHLGQDGAVYRNAGNHADRAWLRIPGHERSADPSRYQAIWYFASDCIRKPQCRAWPSMACTAGTGHHPRLLFRHEVYLSGPDYDRHRQQRKGCTPGRYFNYPL